MPVPSGTLTTTTGALGPQIVKTAFDTTLGQALYELPTFRMFADKRPVSPAMQSEIVTMTITGDLPISTTPLSESLDVDAVELPASRQLNVQLNEYGNAVVDTLRLRNVEFTKSIAQEKAGKVARNAVDTIDKVYQNVIDGGTNVLWVTTGGVPTLTDPTTNRKPLSAKATATAINLLRRRLAKPWHGDMHHVVAHNDVLFDLMAEVGNGTWRQPHEQVDTSGVYTAHVGDFMGARFFAHNKCTIDITAGANPDAYYSYFMGREALVEFVKEDISGEVGPQIDKLNRFYTLGWYAHLGVSIYRQNCLQIVKSSSSINTDLFTGTNPAFDAKA